MDAGNARIWKYFKKITSEAIKIPFSSPNIMNWFPAPCQMPVTKKVKIIVRLIVNNSGAFGYLLNSAIDKGACSVSVKNLVNVMCQRFQKSTKFVACKGELKLIGNVKPNIFARPMPISQ